MATKLDDFMDSVATEEAWKKISIDFCWNEVLLEKYQKNVDWSEIICNSEIMWTIPMLQKFSKYIDWKKFSDEAGEETLTPLMLETFKDKWDWHELSGNRYLVLTDELLTRYADLWDWGEIIDSYNNKDLFKGHAIEFFEKYREYIPASKLQDSFLWGEIIEQRKTEIINDIIS